MTGSGDSVSRGQPPEGAAGAPDITAVEIVGAGGPEVLRAIRQPRPQPQAGEVLIEVAAAGVNRPDVLQRKGVYPPPVGASLIPGLEVAGRVAALGAEVSGWQVGDPVCALVAGGGYASACLAPVGQCLPIPDGVSMVEAAGLPETVFTVWTNVFERGRLRPGESLLVHGGAGGIGTTAIQLAHALGSTVYATAGRADKCVLCTRLGARRAINYREEDFVAVVRAETGGRGVDVVLDMIGGDYLPRNLECLAEEGRHISIAHQAGSKATLNIRTVMVRRLTLSGSTLRPLPVAAKTAIAQAVRDRVWPLVAAGRVRPLIHATVPLAEAARAHAILESGDHVGKVILTVSDAI